MFYHEYFNLKKLKTLHFKLNYEFISELKILIFQKTVIYTYQARFHCFTDGKTARFNCTSLSCLILYNTIAQYEVFFICKNLCVAANSNVKKTNFYLRNKVSQRITRNGSDVFIQIFEEQPWDKNLSMCWAQSCGIRSRWIS